MKRTRAGALLLVLAVLATGCRGDEEPVQETGVATEPAAEGLSPEEIRRRAEPMTPEDAERLGIVDTTIHVEQLATPEDTLLMPDTLPPPGTPLP